MGVVYKALDTTLDRHVAIKFLPPQLKSDKDAKTRFIHEAKAASALNHGNIAVVHEIDETPEGQMFIVMAYYEGQTLKDKLEGGALGVDESIAIVSEIASGLHMAHEKGIICRLSSFIKLLDRSRRFLRSRCMNLRCQRHVRTLRPSISKRGVWEVWLRVKAKQSVTALS